MENKQENIDSLKEINRRLGKLEQRVIDLIVPIQNIVEFLKSETDIKDLIKVLQQPLSINDLNLKNILNRFDKEMRMFERHISNFNDKIKETAPGEIKYIGNRLNEIEKILNKLLQEQVKKEVQIQFSCDGYELVKKPIGYDINDPIEEPLEDLKKLLNSFNQERMSLGLIHRFGLLGQKPKTYVQIGKILNISPERASAMVKKALVLCRCPARSNRAKKIKDKELRKAIFGEES